MERFVSTRFTHKCGHITELQKVAVSKLPKIYDRTIKTNCPACKASTPGLGRRILRALHR